MVFQLNNHSPYYEQIESNISKLISINVIKEGEKIPSIRELATILTINPNTVSKAYMNLEKLGVIETLKGSGTFVKEGAKQVVESKNYNILLNKIEEVVKVANELNINFNTLVDMENEIYNNVKRGKNDRY